MQKISILLILLLSNWAFSQSVEKVKGSKALLDMGTENYSVGMEIVSVTADGRKVGLMKVIQVKNNKAIAEVIKGTVAAGMTLAPKPAPKKRFADEPSDIEMDGKKSTNSKSAFGVIAGYSMDALTMTTTTTTTFAGSTFKLKGLYDYNLSPAFTLRFSGGLDGFNVVAGVSNLAIQYIALDGAAQWNFINRGAKKFWLGGGYSYQYPSSSSNNIGITTSSNNVIFFGAGADFPIGKKGYMPVYFHYNYMPPSTGISLYSIEFGAGYAWN